VAIRGRLGVKLVERRGSTLQMLKILRRGGRVVIVIDQRLPPWYGILVDFLGRPAWSTPMAAKLSTRTGAPVVPAFCLPAPGGRYRTEVGEPIFPEGRGEAAEAALTRRHLATVEERIRERPELWLWMHRRWKLTHRHEDPTSLERNRKQAALPDGPSLDDLAVSIPRDAADALHGIARDEFLEDSRDALLCGDGADSAATAVAARLLGEGHVVRRLSAAELAGEMHGAEAMDKLGRWYRELDRVELVLVHGLEAATLPGAAALIELLQQRQGRRSTLLACRAGSGTLRDLAARCPGGAEVMEPWLRRAAVVDVGAG
jgi:hypothetical protein